METITFEEIEQGSYFFAKNTKNDERNLYLKTTEDSVRDLKSGDCFGQGHPLTTSLFMLDEMCISDLVELEVVTAKAQRKNTVMFNLTDYELSVRSSDMASAELEASKHRDLETQYKDKAKNEKTLAEEQEEIRHKLAMAIKYKQEERKNTLCPEFYDFVNEVAICINPVSGVVMSTRDLTYDEKQPPLFDEEETEEATDSEEVETESIDQSEKVESAVEILEESGEFEFEEVPEPELEEQED